MFKKGDMIRCVYTEVKKMMPDITFGKIYKVSFDNKFDNIFWSTKVWIINDKNIEDWYFAIWFVGIQEERKKKLNKLKI